MNNHDYIHVNLPYQVDMIYSRGPDEIRLYVVRVNDYIGNDPSLSRILVLLYAAYISCIKHTIRHRLDSQQSFCHNL